MDFTFDDEQQMLAASVERWLAADYDFEARRGFAAQPLGFEPANWDRLAEFGLLGINVPERYGGSGRGAVETLIVMEAFGRFLLVEPYISTAVVGAHLLGLAGNDTQRQDWLRAIAEGSRKLALAALEPEARFDLHQVSTTAKRSKGSGFVIEGRKAVVLHGDSADGLIVSARTSGNETDTDGITLLLIDAHAPGVTIKGFPTIDGQRAAEIELRSVNVGEEAVLGKLGSGLEILERGIDFGLAALCAEAVGAMEQLMQLTVAYLQARKQFGAALGSFQALQHRVADMAIAIEQSRSMALCAAAKVDTTDRDERRRALSAAKALIGRNGRYIGQQAVQLHGGMGMTDALPVGYYFKRLTCIDMTWGDTDHHVELYVQAL
jgi:alkylation response protein AidB-like acyl-CoA dehydrogenase